VVPTPYFYRDGAQIRIHSPVFMPVIYDLLERNPVRSGLLSFVWNVGLRTCVHDDLCVAGTTLRRGGGWLPPLEKSRSEILTQELAELQQLCEEHGSQLFIVCLRRGFDDAPLDELDSKQYSIIDPFEALAAALPKRSQEAWGKRYYHWRGDPAVLVDMHPSEHAHKIIGEVIAEKIRDTEGVSAKVTTQGSSSEK
jgi:hypothetical protein